MNRLGLCLAFCVSLATAGFLYAAAFAQEQGKEDVYSEEQYHETQALIDRMQVKINTINSAVSESVKMDLKNLLGGEVGKVCGPARWR